MYEKTNLLPECIFVNADSGSQWSTGLRVDTEVDGDEKSYFVKVSASSRSCWCLECLYISVDYRTRRIGWDGDSGI